MNIKSVSVLLGIIYYFLNCSKDQVQQMHQSQKAKAKIVTQTQRFKELAQYLV